MIRNYNEIQIKPNSLVILDIDETILSFLPITPSWWNDIKKTHTDDYAYKAWISIISFNLPYLLDEREFFKLLNEIKIKKSKLVFLTARNRNLCELTIQQLVYCNIPFIPEDLWFSDKKGITIHKMKRRYNKSHVLFVDDKITNIMDVKKWNPEIACYHLQHINL